MSDLCALQQEGFMCKCTEQGQTWVHNKSEGCFTAPIFTRFISGSILPKVETKCCSGAKTLRGLETQTDNKHKSVRRESVDRLLVSVCQLLNFKGLHAVSVKTRGINRVSHFVARWLTVEAWFISHVIYDLPYGSCKYTKKIAFINLFNLVIYLCFWEFTLLFLLVTLPMLFLNNSTQMLI